MNLREIREECWDQARDEGNSDADRLWPTPLMNRYINRVYKIIARKTKCIRDATTPEVVLINCDPVDYTTLTPGTLDYIWANDPNMPLYQKDVCPYIYALHDSILDVHEVKFVERQWYLVRQSPMVWQRQVRWEQVIGSPTEYTTELETQKLAVNYRAEDSDVLQMVVTRMPLVDLIQDTDVPEIPLAYHDRFYNGVLGLMYKRQDVEAFDMNKGTSNWEAFKEDIDDMTFDFINLTDGLNPTPAGLAHT